MNLLAKSLALLALAGTFLPPVLYALKVLGDGPMKAVMLAAAVVWFAAAPFWLKGGQQ
jgi:hypothetical protein